MEKIKSILKQPLMLGVTGIIVGLMIGLLIGWVVWPVTWTSASPGDLQIDFQRDYVCMIIDSYVRNSNVDLMQVRWKGLGEKAVDLLNTLTPATCRFSSSAEIDAFKTIVNVPVQTSVSTTTTPLISPTSTTTAPASNLSFLPILLFCGLTLAAGGIFAYLLIKRGKTPRDSEKAPEDTLIWENEQVNKEVVEQESLTEKPLTQFMTTYRMGDELYDESFSIDSISGEFLGECGVGVAETIGVGEPKKVTALELWLFDKNDVQTVTKVLYSEHAYRDETIRQSLLSKGEPILAKPGQRFIMETASLQLEARVIDLIYGRGPLPENSFFSRVTMEISVWTKVQ